MVTETCEACGKRYNGLGELDVINYDGLGGPPNLCQSCIDAWNTRRAHKPPDTARADFEQFKRGRRASAN